MLRWARRRVDLAKPLSQAAIDAIKTAWRARFVVVIRGKVMSDPQLLAFSRRFGELDPPGPKQAVQHRLP
jgi:taurine dioxygenase